MNGVTKMMMMQQVKRSDGDRMEKNALGEYYPPREARMVEAPEMRREYDSIPESRFRDRTGREHYDNGRFAPVRNGMEDEPPEMRRANMYALPRNERYSNLIGFTGGEIGEHHPQEQRMGAMPLDHETAQEWVRNMKNADGTTGQHWTMEQAKNLMTQVGATGVQPVEFWAILNALRSDYFKVAKKYGVDRPEFYGELTKAWLDDADAVENKAAMYYECIVK